MTQDPQPAACDCTHGEFLMPGNADLPYQEYIEIGVKLFRDFKTDRHAPARQRENQCLCAHIAKLRGEFAPCLSAIAK
jgi:hypothetical protein